MRKRSAQDLDGNLTVEPCIAGAPDFAHPTCAQWGEDFIWAKMLVGPKCHFFNSAAQLTTTVSGAFGSKSTDSLIRKRCPPAVTEYGARGGREATPRNSKSETVAPTSKLSPLFTWTATSFLSSE